MEDNIKIEKKLLKMKKELDEKLLKYETRFPKIKGISNITRCDIESAIFRIDLMLRGKYYGYMKAIGNIKSLFEAYGIDPEYNNGNIY